MNNLPDWLWPEEDEEAVLEAERLIEETHRALQKIESDILQQNSQGDILNLKTEKLKSSVLNKLDLLEGELKDVSKVAGCLKPKGSNSQCRNEHLKSTPACQSVHRKADSQEMFVMTAHNKIGDALRVAQSVSASLDQHSPSNSSPAKPIPFKTSNVGIFEIKSLTGGNEEMGVHSRLVKSQLSAISIKRNLEFQSIPSVYVPPSEKPSPHNVALCHAEHQDGHSYKKLGDHQESVKVQERELKRNESLINERGINLDSNKDVAQLSMQLAQVEELRELNQAQVNHVLRFLISKVAALSNLQNSSEEAHTLPRLTTEDNSKKVVKLPEPETLLASQSTSSSDSSRPKIVYDSLSRFLETYKQAAHHALRAEKKAAQRQKKEVAKRKKHIEYAERPSNHLLICSLGQSGIINQFDSGVNKIEPAKSFCGSEVCSSFDSSEKSLQNVQRNGICGTNTCNDRDKSNLCDILNETQLKECSLKPSERSSVDSLEAHVSVAIGDDYEDDWEEEIFEDPADVVQVQERNLLVNTIGVEEKSNSTHNGSTQPSLKLHSEVAMLASLRESVSQEPLQVVNDSCEIPDQSRKQECSLKLTPPVTLKAVSTVTDGHYLFPQSFSEELQTSTERSTSASGKKKPFVDNSSRQKRARISQQMNRFQRASSNCSSSTDSDGLLHAQHNRMASHSRKGRELKLKEDLHLKSAILLNLQLEDRLKSRLNEAPPQLVHQEHPAQNLQSTLQSDVEERWKKALDELDERIKTMEEYGNITRLLQNLSVRTREEQTQTSPMSKQLNLKGYRQAGSPSSLVIEKMQAGMSLKVSSEKHNLSHPQPNNNQKISSQAPIPPESQDVNEIIPECLNVLPVKYNSGIPSEENVLKKLSSEQSQRQTFNEKLVSNDFMWNRPELASKFIKERELNPSLILSHESGYIVSQRLWHCGNRDLTEDLLTYTNMGASTKMSAARCQHSDSLSSSTSSSFRPNNVQVSLSDGEMLANGSDGWSCSEGELHLSQTNKEELAPLKKVCSGAPSYDDKDESQGEIALSGAHLFLGDTSQGEVALGTGESSPVAEMSD